MTTIVYLHGFRSSPASGKARALQEGVAALPAARRPQLHVPELDDRPLVAVQRVMDWIARDATATPTFVGSSLGGYYATHLAEHYSARAVLINPAVCPYEDLAPYIGVQSNLYTGREFEVTPAHFDELRAIDTARLAQPSRYLLYVQSGDEVLDWRVAVARYAGAWQCVEGGGDHGFTGFERHLPTLLRFAENGFGD